MIALPPEPYLPLDRNPVLCILQFYSLGPSAYGVMLQFGTNVG
jgi:hypothetical protein